MSRPMQKRNCTKCRTYNQSNQAAMKENKQGMYVENYFKKKNYTQIKSGCRGKLLSIYESNQKKEIKTKVAISGWGCLP